MGTPPAPQDMPVGHEIQTIAPTSEYWRNSFIWIGEVLLYNSYYTFHMMTHPNEIRSYSTPYVFKYTSPHTLTTTIQSTRLGTTRLPTTPTYSPDHRCMPQEKRKKRDICCCRGKLNKPNCLFRRQSIQWNTA